MLVNMWASSHRYLTNPESWPKKPSRTHSLSNRLWHARVTQRRGHSRPEHTILSKTDTAFQQFPRGCSQGCLHTSWERLMYKERLTWCSNGVPCRKVLKDLHPHRSFPPDWEELLTGEPQNSPVLLCLALLKCLCPNTPPPGVRWCDPSPVKGRCLFILLLF